MSESEPLLYGGDAVGPSRGCCLQVVQTEFRKKNFGFSYETDEIFLRSQWPCPQWLFITYRVIVAAYALTITFLSIFRFDHDVWRLPWSVWLTNWSFFLLTCHLVCALLNVILDAVFGRRNLCSPSVLWPSHRKVPGHIKIDSLLFCVAAPAAGIVTVVYFAAVFPTRHRGVSTEDINVHMMNSVLVLLELTFTALPIRLLHIVYTWLYGMIYVAFSAVYWYFDHANVMYPGVLDWNQPVTTIIVLVVLMFVGVPILQSVLFLIYRLRVFTHRQCVLVVDTHL